MGTREVRQTFTKWAPYYDLFHRMPYRDRAVERLELRGGDAVLDIGCGTGASFERILKKIGGDGILVGMDCTAAMLVKAKEKTHRSRSRNVELVCGDAANIPFKEETFSGVHSAYVIAFIPRYDLVLKESARVLRPDGRLAAVDVKPASGRVAIIMNPLVRSSFGACCPDPSHALESGAAAVRLLGDLLEDVSVEEHYFGALYVASGR